MVVLFKNGGRTCFQFQLTKIWQNGHFRPFLSVFDVQKRKKRKKSSVPPKMALHTGDWERLVNPKSIFSFQPVRNGLRPFLNLSEKIYLKSFFQIDFFGFFRKMMFQMTCLILSETFHLKILFSDNMPYRTLQNSICIVKVSCHGHAMYQTISSSVSWFIKNSSCRMISSRD